MPKLPDPHDTIWTTCMWLTAVALGIVVVANVLKENSRKGYSWWLRLIILTAMLFAAHVIQNLGKWDGLPGFLGLVIFPLLPGYLADQYYYLFLDLGFSYEISGAESRKLGLIHAGFVGLVIAAMVFFWNLTRPTSYSFKYGDDEVAGASPRPTGKSTRVTYGS